MQDLIANLLTEIKRDKKKSIIMAVLLAVAMVLVVRMVLKRPSPAPASAAAPAARPSAQASTPGTDSGAEEPASDTNRDRYIKQIDSTVKRDVFTPTPGYFPEGKSSGRGRLSSDSTGGMDSDQEAVWKEGRDMVLESTILSASPKAIIKGQLVQAGDYVSGFRVLEIRPHSVVLEKDGVTVNLEMKHQ